MVTYYVKKDEVYKVSATTECVVKDGNGEQIAVLAPGESITFKAPTTEITLSDDNAAFTRIQATSGTGAGSSAECIEHIANTGIHVTQADKQRWDNAPLGTEFVYNAAELFPDTPQTLAYLANDLSTYLTETNQADKVKPGLMMKFINSVSGMYQTWRYNGGDIASWESWSLQIYYEELQGTVNQAVKNIKTVLPGTVEHYAGSTVPDGYLLCDGSEVSRTDYAALFAAIGTTWGEGDGSTTFALPNLIDRVIWGASTAGEYLEAGLPNIEGTFNACDSNSNYIKIYGSGVFSNMTTTSSNLSGSSSGTKDIVSTVGFNASRSSSIYGNSETVQPPAAKLIPIIKY